VVSIARKSYVVKIVTRNGRKYVVLSYSLYRDLIKLIDEILELVEEIRELRRVE